MCVLLVGGTCCLVNVEYVGIWGLLWSKNVGGWGLLQMSVGLKDSFIKKEGVKVDVNVVIFS